MRPLCGEGESLYTISVNGPHNAKSALEDMSKKQVKVLLPPLNLPSSQESPGSSHRVTFADDDDDAASASLTKGIQLPDLKSQIWILTYFIAE